MESVKKERAVIRRAFTKSANELEAILTDSGFQHNQDAIVAFKKLAEYEDNLNLLNEKMKNLMLTSDFVEEEYEKEVECTEIYHSRWLKLSTMFDQTRDATLKKISVDPAHSTPKLRLPSLELQSFDGEIKNWLPFWGQFKKIDTDPAIDVSDKYLYLLQAMKPASDVKRLVESFPTTSYKECVSQLKERYGREDLLIQVYVRELLALILNKQGNIDISELHDKLSAHLRALESLGVTNDKYAAFLVPMVESALPQELLILWERCREDFKDEKSELTKILKFIKREVDSEQRIKLANSTFFKENHEDKITEKKTAECLVSASKQTKCNLCVWCGKDTHSSLECYKPNKLSIEERKKHLVEKKACMICLRIGHVAKRCRSQVKCFICQRRHSTLVCMEKISEKEKPTTSVSTAHGEETVLLQTVIVMIEHNNRREGRRETL